MYNPATDSNPLFQVDFDWNKKPIICINISEMVKQKYKIPMQYETINIGGNSDDMHFLCRKIDRYLLHIVEEIAEFLKEFNDINTKFPDLKNYTEHKECLMELIDVTAYITSLLSLFYIDLNGLENTKNLENSFERIFNDEISSLKNEDVKNVVNEKLLNIESILINGIRRNFPERKWHKDTDRILSVKELYDLYKSCIRECTKALYVAVLLFLYLTDMNVDLFTQMFLDKNEEVYSLKK